MKLETTLKKIGLGSLLVLSACYNNKEQSKANISKARQSIQQGLQELTKDQVCDVKTSHQIENRLNKDFDYYLANKEITSDQLLKRFSGTVREFNGFRINGRIFRVIESAYNSIASDIVSKNFPKHSNLQLEMSSAMRKWFESYQSRAEKFADLTADISRDKAGKHYINVPENTFDSLIMLISSFKQNTSPDQLKQALTNTLRQYNNSGEDVRSYATDVLYRISLIEKIDLKDQLYPSAHNQVPIPVQKTSDDLKKEVKKRFDILLKDEMINAKTYNLVTKTIYGDIDHLANDKTSNTTVLKQRLTKSLGILDDQVGDTEDREAVADVYYTIAQRKRVDIKNELNKWLYGFSPETN